MTPSRRKHQKVWGSSGSLRVGKFELRALVLKVSGTEQPRLPRALSDCPTLFGASLTPLRSYYKPHRHPLVFDRLPGVAGYTIYLATADFAAGRGGLLQLRDTSSVTVLSLPPRRSDKPSQPDYGPPCCLRPRIASSTSRVIFRGHIRVRLTTARRLAAISKMALSMGFRDSVSLLPAIRATRLWLLPWRD